MAPGAKTQFGPIAKGPTATAGQPVITGYDKEGRPVMSEPKAQVGGGGGGGGGPGKSLFGDIVEGLAAKGFIDPAAAALYSYTQMGQGLTGAEMGRDRMRQAVASMEGQQHITQDLQNRMAKEQLRAAQLQNSAAHQAQLDKANAGRGGGLGGMDGPSDSMMDTYRKRAELRGYSYQPKEYSQRVDEEKDFQANLRREQLMAEMKMRLLGGLFGQVAGGIGGGPRTTTEETHGQQIVNNAGRWEPRDVVTTSSKTEPIDPVELIRSIFGSGIF